MCVLRGGVASHAGIITRNNENLPIMNIRRKRINNKEQVLMIIRTIVNIRILLVIITMAMITPTTNKTTANITTTIQQN